MTTLDRRSPRPLVLTAVVLVVGAMLSVLAYRYTAEQSRQRVEARFDDSVDRSRAAIERELSSDLDKLSDVGAFMLASGPPTEEAFAGYVTRAGVFQRFDSLLGVIVIERVEPGGMDAFLARQRAVRPDFNVVPLGPVPADAPHYVVTYYEKGSIDFSLPTGLDVSAIQSVQDELETRGRRGEAGAGALQNDPVIKQLSGTDIRLQQFDFLMGVPVWDKGKDHAHGDMPSVWISAPIGRFDEILKRGLDGVPGDIGVRLTVNIQSTNFSDSVRRVSERKDAPGPLDQAALRRDVEFGTDGIQWSMTAWSSPDPVGEADDKVPMLVLYVGLIATLVVALGVYARMRGLERDRRLVALQAAHDRIVVQRDVLSSVREAVVVLDPAGRVLTANAGWERLRGRAPVPAEESTPDEGEDYVAIMSEVAVSDVRELAAALEHVRNGDDARADVELPLETDGQRWWTAVRVTPLTSEPGGVVILHRDVTEQRRSMAELKLRASHDSLTGLLNRAALEEEARHRITRVRQSGGLVGALFVDLDDFKLVNDVYGHEAGDVVLSVVAQRITGATRLTDLVARQGGDEFVVVLEPLAEPGVADELAARLLTLIEQPIATDEVTLTIKASIGVVVLDGGTDASLAGLLRKADNAMYESKQSGGARYTVARS